MEHEEHEDMPKEKMSPEMCVKAGKCMLADMVKQMSREEYLNKPDEEKDKIDEEEVMKEK